MPVETIGKYLEPGPSEPMRPPYSRGVLKQSEYFLRLVQRRLANAQFPVGKRRFRFGERKLIVNWSSSSSEGPRRIIGINLSKGLKNASDYTEYSVGDAADTPAHAQLFSYIACAPTITQVNHLKISEVSNPGRIPTLQLVTPLSVISGARTVIDEILPQKK